MTRSSGAFAETAIDRRLLKSLVDAIAPDGTPCRRTPVRVRLHDALLRSPGVNEVVRPNGVSLQEALDAYALQVRLEPWPKRTALDHMRILETLGTSDPAEMHAAIVRSIGEP